jgi:predicted transcriptional regulator of viral defense system
MIMDKKNNYIDDYLIAIQSEGKLYFSISEILEVFPKKSNNAIQANITRLGKKGKIKHVMKGFYSIIPPEYLIQKMIPPELFIAPLFKHLKRDYYVGLLSAAFYHGSSHQQHQEYFVMINHPPIRTKILSNIKINFIVNARIEKCVVDKKKSRTGYFNVSSIEQTVIDLMDFQDIVGGIDRVSAIINDLLINLSAEKLKVVLPAAKTISSIQRLGYLLEVVFKNDLLAKVIEEFLSGRNLFNYELKPGKGRVGYNINKKWKIIENDKIEME